MIGLLPGDIVKVHGDAWVERWIEDASHATYSHDALYTGSHSLYEAKHGRQTAKTLTAKQKHMNLPLVGQPGVKEGQSKQAVRDRIFQ